jgi:hypothetical protein
MDLLFHMIIPVMLGLTAGLDRRRALMLAPIAIIPDLDVLLVAHRVYLHTVFIPVTIAALGLFLFRLKQRALIHFPLPRREFLLASLYYLSHLLLDICPGPVAVFWPLTSVGYGLNIGVAVNQQSVIPTVQPYIGVVTRQFQIPNVVTNVAAATPESIVTAILLLAVMLLTRHKEGKQ